MGPRMSRAVSAANESAIAYELADNPNSLASLFL